MCWFVDISGLLSLTLEETRSFAHAHDAVCFGMRSGNEGENFDKQWINKSTKYTTHPLNEKNIQSPKIRICIVYYPSRFLANVGHQTRVSLNFLGCKTFHPRSVPRRKFPNPLLLYLFELD